MKTLIAYFSWSNNTKNLIEKINKDFNYDVVRIERKRPYSDDYNTCAYVEAKEEVEKNIFPEINRIDVEFNDYDRILLFFPIWWYTFPMPVGSFIKSLNGYKGKIIVFANSYTNDPQYMTNSIRDLERIDNKLNFVKGLFNDSLAKHKEFIRNN